MLAQINRVAFELVGIPIYWYALIIVSGIIIAMWLSSREAVRVGLKADDVTDFMLWGLPISIIGARLYYVLFDLPQYIADPIQIFNIRSGGLAIYGGLIAGAITLYFLLNIILFLCGLFRYRCTKCIISTSNRSLGKFHEPRSIWTRHDAKLLRKSAFTAIHH